MGHQDSRYGKYLTRAAVDAVAGGFIQGGIGRAIAHTFANEGCQLAIAVRGQEAPENVAEELRGLGTQALAVPADLTRAKDGKRLVTQTLQRFRRIDLLV